MTRHTGSHKLGRAARILLNHQLAQIAKPSDWIDAAAQQVYDHGQRGYFDDADGAAMHELRHLSFEQWRARQ